MEVDLKKHSMNLIISITVLFVGTVLLELVARQIWHTKYNEWLEKQLHGFDYVDYGREIILPIPNTRTTIYRYKKDLQTHGKILAISYFDETINADVAPDSLVLFNINRLGFKGPEVDIPKPDSIYRILTIGNSCTWGPPNDYFTYPRTMERELNAQAGTQVKFEVVNAGVLGYNFERVLKRIDEFLAVEPDLITIHLGWNRTIKRADPAKNLFLYRKFALYKILYHFFINRAHTGLDQDFNQKTYFKKDAPEIKKLEEYSFKYDLHDLAQLVKIIRNKNRDTKIIVITLAGMFDYRVDPDERALKLGYPIASNQNLYSYCVLTKKWNQNLREFARAHQIYLIDFETKALTLFNPRSAFFYDSVHPIEEGYLKMGKYFASELMGIIDLQELTSR